MGDGIGEGVESAEIEPATTAKGGHGLTSTKKD